MVVARRRRTAIGMSFAALLVIALGALQPVAARSPDPRIIGGAPAAVGEYPFMVAVLLEPIEGNDLQKQFCGGALIAPTWVLTAAHCAEIATEPSDLAVAVARTDLDSPQGERRAVSAIHIHPDFDSAALTPDVALLQLASRVTATPVTLATAMHDRFETAGTQLTVIGWGNTDTRPHHASFPDGLREVVVPAVSDATCAHAYKGFFAAATMLCAGSKRLDSCQGDSGGPLFADAASRIQLGVVSFGFKCAKTHFPGVYAEVNAPLIRDWIRSVSGV